MVSARVGDDRSEAAAREARIDVTVLWSLVSIPYATYTLDIFQPGVVEVGADAEEGKVAPSPILTGVTFELKCPFFEGLLMGVVGLQDATITHQPQMGEIHLRYHEGEETLVKVDANLLYRHLEEPHSRRIFHYVN